MVEMFFNPLTDEFQLPEINDKTVFVQFGCLESKFDAPVMSVDKGTVPIVSVLPVGKRDVSVDFGAGEHDDEKKCSLYLWIEANGNFGKNRMVIKWDNVSAKIPKREISLRW